MKKLSPLTALTLTYLREADPMRGPDWNKAFPVVRLSYENMLDRITRHEIRVQAEVHRE